MADKNPFTKYAAPAKEVNPFAKYAATEQPVEEAIAPTQTGYDLVDVPLAAIKNVPASAGKLVSGIVDVLSSPLESAKGLLDAAAGGLHNVLPERLTKFVDDLENNPEAVNRAVKTANAIGGMYKERYGGYENIKRTLATDPVGVAADISTLLTGGAGAVRVGAGGVYAGASRVGAGAARAVTPAVIKAASVAEKVSIVGAAINPMRPIAPIVEYPVKLAAKGIGGVYNMLSPKASTYLEAVEGKGAEVVNALRTPSEIVPGSKPTAAQAAAQVGATKFSALGKEAAEVLPSESFALGAEQKAAQIKQVQAVGKTKPAIEAAETARREAVSPLYDKVNAAVVESDDVLLGLMNRPSVRKVTERARELVAEKDLPFVTEGKQLVDTAGKPLGRATVSYPGSSLHAMKMAFDDLINTPERFGIGAAEVAAIKGTRSKFIEWLENKVPEYKVARETFAERSKPINTMQVGQYLEGKLVPALGEDTAKLRAAGYATALENAPGTIKRATGQSRFEELSEILTPDDIAKLEAVRDDLARARLAEQQASAARTAAPSLKESGTEAIGSIRAPGMLSRIVTTANDIMRRLQGKLDQRLAIEIATEMLDPKLAAAAIEKALARQAKGQKLAAPFKKVGKAASTVIRTPAPVNMLSPLQESNNSLME